MKFTVKGHKISFLYKNMKEGRGFCNRFQLFSVCRDLNGRKTRLSVVCAFTRSEDAGLPGNKDPAEQIAG